MKDLYEQMRPDQIIPGAEVLVMVEGIKEESGPTVLGPGVVYELTSDRTSRVRLIGGSNGLFPNSALYKLRRPLKDGPDFDSENLRAEIIGMTVYFTPRYTVPFSIHLEDAANLADWIKSKSAKLGGG